jgi:hypothetical protein
MSTRPSHTIWAVQKSANANKRFWTKIDAALQHEDRDGMTLKLALLPLAGQDLGCPPS